MRIKFSGSYDDPILFTDRWVLEVYVFGYFWFKAAKGWFLDESMNWSDSWQSFRLTLFVFFLCWQLQVLPNNSVSLLLQPIADIIPQSNGLFDIWNSGTLRYRYIQIDVAELWCFDGVEFSGSARVDQKLIRNRLVVELLISEEEGNRQESQRKSSS